MSENTESDYYKLSHNSFTLFVQMVRQAATNNKYDLILAGGDSGSIMTWITNAVYENLNISPPPRIVLPVYRHADYAETILFDNKTLKLKLVLPKVKLENILLVDDEAGTGNTARGLLETLGAVTNDRPKVTFIAEDDGFDASKITGWKLDFKPPQLKVKDVYNAVSYIVPYDEFQLPVKAVLNPIVKDLNDKHVMATLLNLPIKEYNDGQPEFTFQFRDECLSQIEAFPNMQQRFQDFIRNEIRLSCDKL